MPQYTVSKAMLGGLLGTLGQTLLVYGLASLLTGQAIDRGAMFGYTCPPALFMRLFSGSVLFPLGYVYLAAQSLPGSPMLKGVLWAGLLWSVSEGVLAPMLGAGVFNAELGGLPAALRALLGYFVYGATLGGFVGAGQPESRYAYTPYTPALLSSVAARRSCP